MNFFNSGYFSFFHFVNLKEIQQSRNNPTSICNRYFGAWQSIPQESVEASPSSQGLHVPVGGHVLLALRGMLPGPMHVGPCVHQAPL